jgi:hypothetical protein
MRTVFGITIVGALALGGCAQQQQSPGAPSASMAIASSQGAPSAVTPAASSKQIVFASTNAAGAGGPLTPFGFWIWCIGAGTVPYTGNCTGSMYFYGTTPPKPVADSASPLIVGESATVHVAATDGSFQCDLTGPVGKRVAVSVTCNTGPRTGNDTMPNSNVVVTP